MTLRHGLCILVTLAGACSRPTPSRNAVSSDAAIPRATPAFSTSNQSTSVRLAPAQFHLTATPSAGAARNYLASTDDPAPACRFQIQLGSPRPIGGAPFAMTNVTLGREPGADCTRFLQRLGKALALSDDVQPPGPADALSCSYAMLGTHQSREDDPDFGASFSSTPAGNWTCGKLFLADGEGEVYLNLNEPERVGEFSLKDEGYATIVITELSKILLPRAG
jgi:hypothetical protein